MRYPLARLEALLRPRTTAELARRIGVDERTVYRWRDEGLSEHQADHAACRAGLHPLLVWPEWADELDVWTRMALDVEYGGRVAV